MASLVASVLSTVFSEVVVLLQMGLFVKLKTKATVCFNCKYPQASFKKKRLISSKLNS